MSMSVSVDGDMVYSTARACKIVAAFILFYCTQSHHCCNKINAGMKIKQNIYLLQYLFYFTADEIR